MQKWGRENIFKPTIGNESLHQDSNYNFVRIVIVTCAIVVDLSTHPRRRQAAHCL
jgi:hypothetical protein